MSIGEQIAKLRGWIEKDSAKRSYTCDVCGRELFDYPFRRLCMPCEDRIVYNSGRVCPVCGRAVVSRGVCLTCKSKRPVFDVASSPIVYKGLAPLIILRFKNGDKYFKNYLSERMTEKAKVLLAELNDPILVNVPLTAEKKKERGFDQAGVLAEALSEKLGTPYERDVLMKTKETKQQKDLTIEAREENLIGAYRVHKRLAVEGKDVLLIDDVMTTGITGSACARVLKMAGARKVCFLTAAATCELK